MIEDDILGTITGIEEVGIGGKAVRVWVDDEEIGCAHAKVWKKSKLMVGDELSAEKWEQLNETQRRYAQDTALFYLQKRMLSAKELRQKLTDAGYQPEAIQAALDKLSGYGFVDDAALADALVKGALSAKGWGKRRINQKLMDRGIDKQESIRAMEMVGEDEEEAVVRTLLPTLLHRYSSEPDALKRKQKIAQALMRRGFGWQVISRVLGAQEEEQD